MKYAAALLIVAFAACEKKPTEEEIAEQHRKEERIMRATPTPRPGEWMWHSKSALDKPGDKH